jgi:anti-anti-sigma regulatory factor
MPITTRTSGNITVVNLERKLTADDWVVEFDDMLRTLIETGQNRVVVNCVSLGYLDSAENDGFVKACRLAQAHGATIKIMLPRGRWGGMTGQVILTALFEEYDTEAAAIASFGGDKA